MDLLLVVMQRARMDQDALSQIALTVSDGVVGHIRNAKSAREAWLKICSVFEQKGLSSQIFLRRKLINVKLDESQSMQIHINKIREFADRLEAIGDPVRDRELAIIILSSLPEKFNALIISLEARPPDEITFDSVAIRLLAEEERQNEFVSEKILMVNMHSIVVAVLTIVRDHLRSVISVKEVVILKRIVGIKMVVQKMLKIMLNQL